MKLRVLVGKNQLCPRPDRTDRPFFNGGKHVIQAAVMLRVALDGLRGNSCVLPIDQIAPSAITSPPPVPSSVR